MALASATQDVSIDGYYLEVLDKQQQSYFVGVRNAVYKVAILFGQSLLVAMVGLLEKHAAMPITKGLSLIHI